MKLQRKKIFTIALLMGVSIRVFAQTPTNSITRYEFTELLNQTQCVDCVTPQKELKEKYTQEWFETIKRSPLRALDDIDFDDQGFSPPRGYCVASVVDRGVMQGFPRTTSPFCSGKFCGERVLTVTDFLDALIRTLGGKIRELFPIDRTVVQQRTKTQT